MLGIIGLCVGFIVGLTGIGSGSLLTPLLMVAGGLRPVDAVRTSLAVAALTKGVGALAHLRQGTVNLPTTALLAAGSVPATLLTGASLWALSGHRELVDLWVGRAVAAAAALTAVSLLWRALHPPVPRIRHAGRRLWYVLGGAGAGVAATVSSIGAGAVVAAVLETTSALPAAQVVGTNVAHGAVVALLATSVHALAHLPDPATVGMLGLTSAVGAVAGSRASRWLPDRAVWGAVAVTLLALSWRWL